MKSEKEEVCERLRESQVYREATLREEKDLRISLYSDKRISEGKTLET